MPTPRRLFSISSLRIATLVAFVYTTNCAVAADSNELSEESLGRAFEQTVEPLLKTHCTGCHGNERREAQLDLTRFRSIRDVSQAHQTWATVLERLEADEMPPEEVTHRPSHRERDTVVDWIRAIRKLDADRNAGDPGLVLARRLSNSEYNYSIRDLTRRDIRPAATFPVDPANEAGFDNSGESLHMSPALFSKYLEAARHVADHVVLTPTDMQFAPHPVVTDTDRDKYCVKRIVQFYESQPTDLTSYFFACWKHRSQEHFNDGTEPTERTELADLAAAAGISVKYALKVWDIVTDQDAAGPTAQLQEMFHAIPLGADAAAASSRCESMRDYVLAIRSTLAPQFQNLYVRGNHKGSQPFVLWKNRQYAAHRRTFDQAALHWEGDSIPDGTPSELVVPEDEARQAAYLDALERFCSTFPDAFYISERGRDYLDKPRKSQEAGRLLSAGFHSMMGYFRDDDPLCDLILDGEKREMLDRLWEELDYVASAPVRQYSGFLWFERTDSRYMRDPVFDFARAEDKSASSEVMITRLADLYLAKARRIGGSDVVIAAIEEYFRSINQQIRWVESQRVAAERVHLRRLLQLAQPAWRRKLSSTEEQEIHEFYDALREEGLDHEESIRDSLVYVLMSPHFLYRMDLASAGEGTRSLNGVELASRLSYFLWSTLPDDELASALTFGDSPGPAMVWQQAKRMLSDGRVRGLAAEFFANWLDFRRFEEHNSVARDRFPEFTDELRQAMFEEPIRFVEALVRRDRSVLELLYGDYTFVNPVLADHYGMSDSMGLAEDWRRVSGIGQFGRGGLLPMAVFLTKNSPGLRTSPVKRGYWVVRRLLGERIPPPPPNVPELPADESKLGELSLRQMLAAHRDNKSCAVCHDRFDSIGLAFEGYGPVGEQRRTDLGGHPIDAGATFPGGMKGIGIDGLREYLREHREQEFIDNLCRKLLSYALGRTLLLSDEPLISQMHAKLEADEYRFSSLIESIVRSPQFLTKRGHEQLVEVEK